MKTCELIHNGLYKVGDDIVRFRALNGCLYRPNGSFYGQLYENSEDGSLEVQMSYGTWKKLEPLPISEEILKANGFKCINKNSAYTLMVMSDDGYIIEVYICATNCVFDVEHNYILNKERVVDSTHKCGFYLHELQHALRLCGLRELADNFKLE